MARPHGQLERSLHKLTVGTQLDMRARERALAAGRSGEYDQQVRVAISGEATERWGYTDIPVTWEHPFIYSPLQRKLPFEAPHYVCGVEFAKPPAALVIVVPHLIDWLQSDASWYIGAKLRVAVSAPGQTEPVAYSAVLHLTFEGYAFPTDEENT